MAANTATTKKPARKDVYGLVTARIIEQLEKGTVPWRKPWTEAGIPRNLVSRKPYRGINSLLLNALGYEQNFFLTENQLAELGGSVLAKEKPHMVVYWNYRDRQTPEEVAAENSDGYRKPPVLRYYQVYNTAQCTGITVPEIQEPAREFTPIEACERLVQGMPKRPPIKHREQTAYYDIPGDFLNMPKKNSFVSSEAYYSTLFHELAHSTGHHTRLDRMGLAQMSEYGTELYSQEELVAEITACYLQSLTGITTEFEQSAAYIQGWLQKLKDDTRMVLTAATMAQKAVDYILGIPAEANDTTRQAEAN